MSDNDQKIKEPIQYEEREEHGISKTMAIVTFMTLFLPVAGFVAAIIWGGNKTFMISHLAYTHPSGCVFAVI